MQLEHLTKAQIVLLTLLITFVTSIATGIVTVTLMEKAPAGVTQVINRVVEHTVEKIIPTNTGKATVITEQIIVKEEDLIVKAIEQNLQSVVVWRGTGASGEEIHAGLGFIVSSDGLAVADKGTISWVTRESLTALYQGKRLSVEIVFEKPEYNFFIIKILQPKSPKTTQSSIATTTDSENTQITFTPVSLADSNQVKLGQAAIVLNGKTGTTVSTGIVSDLVKETVINETTKNEETVLKSIRINTRLSPDSAGAPLITTEGSVAGVMVADGTGFSSEAIPVNNIKNIITDITAPAKSDTASSKTTSN